MGPGNPLGTGSACSGAVAAAPGLVGAAEVDEDACGVEDGAVVVAADVVDEVKLGVLLADESSLPHAASVAPASSTNAPVLTTRTNRELTTYTSFCREERRTRER
ncbi:hypothetical protein GCM10007304_00170 [Rhodococcoides trifolii]|uniref:Uncharacterized protein n=1 Tax=Rhodococcoides trifolii TaxID=908250 RepID=A0A917FMQ7_9NOCA|nr:hypothetical protein GCM10007304_00170 [Rhodococcus trifolii]